MSRGPERLRAFDDSCGLAVEAFTLKSLVYIIRLNQSLDGSSIFRKCGHKRMNVSETEEEITLAAFARWVDVSRPGESFTYHVGNLMIDREKIVQLPNYGMTRVYIQPYHTIGEYAWWAYERGKVELVQRKLPDGRFEYIAQKKRRKGKRR